MNDESKDDEELKEFDPKDDILRIADSFSENDYVSRAAEALARSQLTNLRMGITAITGFSDDADKQDDSKGQEKTNEISGQSHECSLDITMDVTDAELAADVTSVAGTQSAVTDAELAGAEAEGISMSAVAQQFEKGEMAAGNVVIDSTSFGGDTESDAERDTSFE